MEKIEIEGFVTWMGDDRIVRTVVKPGIDIGISEARKNSEIVNSLIVEGKSPLIVDNRKIKSITKEARDHFSIKDRETNVSAIAIIIGSSLSRMIANFYLGINKPKIPVKLFNSEEKAVKWCKTFN
ncbi:MAG: hypothetical protein ABJG68_01270 [Crocinitomicaceae bacterium]